MCLRYKSTAGDYSRSTKLGVALSIRCLLESRQKDFGRYQEQMVYFL